MTEPLAIPDLLDAWLAEAQSLANQSRDPGNYIGFSEFLWAIEVRSEHAWQAILTAVSDKRFEPYLGLLAAGPLEDILCKHGDAFIDRIEAEAAVNATFRGVLSGVWQSSMSEPIWHRMQHLCGPGRDDSGSRIDV